MIVLLIVASILSGIIAGMGMGGGTLLIPILTIFFQFKQQMAQGLNLIAFLPTAIVSLIIHCKNKLVDFKIGIPIIITGIIESVFGSILANNINSELLKKLFGIFLLGIGIMQLIFTIKNMCNSKQITREKKYRFVVGFSNKNIK